MIVLVHQLLVFMSIFSTRHILISDRCASALLLFWLYSS